MRYGISITDDPNRYDDIINLPHHQSPTRPHMSMYNRSAQFASFKAMAGYEDMVNEEARLTEDELVLSDEEKDILDRKIQIIIDALSSDNHPEITLTVFVPDKYNQGGSYVKKSGKVKKLNLIMREIVFYADNNIQDGEIINADYVMQINDIKPLMTENIII